MGSRAGGQVTIAQAAAFTWNNVRVKRSEPSQWQGAE